MPTPLSPISKKRPPAATLSVSSATAASAASTINCWPCLPGGAGDLDLRQLRRRRLHLCQMYIGVGRLCHMNNPPVQVDQKTHPPVHHRARLAPHNTGVRNFSVRVRDQRKVQVVLKHKFF